MTPHEKRQELAVLMDLLEARAPRVHYLQRRPMATRSIGTKAELRAALARPQGITTDCSETLTLICRLAGLRPPTAYSYASGLGNTHEMWRHLPRYTNPALALVGALVVFGPEGSLHAAMVRHPGADPFLFSHGGEAGPYQIKFSILRDALDGPATFLSIRSLL